MICPGLYRGVVCAGAAVFALTTGDAVAASDSAGRLEAVFRDYQAAAPGCAVGIFERAEPALVRGFGVADIETGRELDGDTLFYVASVSKQFTALAIAKLIEDGSVRLEDDVRRWVPEMPDYGTPITVRMLLYHTSGLRDFLSLFDMAGQDRYETLDVPTVLRMVTRQKDLNYPAGTQYSYTNTGYFLLARIVAKVSGEPFEAFVRRRILAPLGMNSSYIRHGSNPPAAKVARGYVRTTEGFVLTDTYPAFGGSGGLMTSINDLQKFDRDFQRGHRVWTRRVRDLLLKPGTLSDGQRVLDPNTGLYYAGGLEVGKRRGQNWVSHGGSAAAFKSEYVRLPDLELGVAVLCNRSDARPSRLVEQTLDSMRVPLKGEWPPGPQPRPAPDSAQALDATVIAALVGRYRADEIDAEYVFGRVDNELTTTVSSAYVGEARTGLIQEWQVLPQGALWSGDYTLELQRAPDGTIDGFSLNEERARGIKFRRVD